jgi:peptide/nickel transport system ATP-binding protein/oligopeptide transport system ATP-binding protein
MPLLSVRNLRTWFPVYGGVLRRQTGEIKAVDGVSFEIEPGKTVGLVGESGSGKTTVGRTLLKLIPATSGQALYEGRDILPLGEAEFRPMRKDLQMIFQDPFGSLNPRMTVGAILAEPLEIHFPAMSKEERRERVADVGRATTQTRARRAARERVIKLTFGARAASIFYRRVGAFVDTCACCKQQQKRCSYF